MVPKTSNTNGQCKWMCELTPGSLFLPDKNWTDLITRVYFLIHINCPNFWCLLPEKCLLFIICRIRSNSKHMWGGICVKGCLGRFIDTGCHPHRFNSAIKFFDIKEAISFFLFPVKVPFNQSNHLLHVVIYCPDKRQRWKYGEFVEARDQYCCDWSFLPQIPTVSTLWGKMKMKKPSKCKPPYLGFTWRGVCCHGNLPLLLAPE